MKRTMKQIVTCALAGAMLLTAALPAANVCAAGGGTAEQEIAQFMDCFQPMPILDPDGLSSDCWGAEDVGARDQYNGLEDMNLDEDGEDWSYWDGGILKGDDGKYYMFASRWSGDYGHEGWRSVSKAVYAVSDNLYGPYVDQGQLWTEPADGAAHNVFPFEISKNDPLYEQGYRYAIVTSDVFNGKNSSGGNISVPEANGAIHIAKEIGGVGNWELMPNGHDGIMQRSNSSFGLSNISIAVGPDGKYIATNRNGDIAVADSLTDVWQVERLRVWENTEGMQSKNIEDPVIWYSDGMYHIVANKWDAREAYYLTSENGLDWERHSGVAYTSTDVAEPFLSYEDGTTNKWAKLERPNVYVEDGKFQAMLFAAVNVQKVNDKGHDDNGSKIIVVPFDGEGLKNFAENDDYKDSAIGRDGLDPVDDVSARSWQGEINQNFGSATENILRRTTDTNENEDSIFGEGPRPNADYDSKIGYLKYDLSQYQGKDITSAVLSFVFTDTVEKVDPDTDVLEVTLADSDWTEDNFKWTLRPDMLYTKTETEENQGETIAKSEEFALKVQNTEVKVDVTKLVQKFMTDNPDAQYITFAVCNTRDLDVKMGSKEGGDNKVTKLQLTTSEKVESVSLDKESLEMETGDVEKLNATVVPETAGNRKMTWSSSNESVATVDESGNVEAVGVGNAVITVTTEDGNKTDTCEVTVSRGAVLLPTDDASARSWGPEEDKNFGGETENHLRRNSAQGIFGEGEKPADNDKYDSKILYLKYDISDLKGEKVDLAELSFVFMRANKEEDESKTDSIGVTLTGSDWAEGAGNSSNSNKVTEGDVTWNTAPEMLYTKEQTESDETTYAESEPFSLAEKEKVVTVDVTKLVQRYLEENPDAQYISFAACETAGTYIRLYSSEAAGDKGTKLHIRSSVPAESVTLDQTELKLTEGEAAQLNAAVLPEEADNKGVTWSSSNEEVVSVDENGYVTALKEGSAVVRVTTKDGGHTAECRVTVEAKEPEKIPVTGVTLDRDTLELTEGGTAQLKATVLPADAANQNVSWSSSDQNVADVDAQGNVTAVKGGTAVITVTTSEGSYTAECIVTVKEKTDAGEGTGDGTEDPGTEDPGTEKPGSGTPGQSQGDDGSSKDTASFKAAKTGDSQHMIPVVFAVVSVSFAVAAVSGIILFRRKKK